MEAPERTKVPRWRLSSVGVGNVIVWASFVFSKLQANVFQRDF